MVPKTLYKTMNLYTSVIRLPSSGNSVKHEIRVQPFAPPCSRLVAIFAVQLTAKLPAIKKLQKTIIFSDFLLTRNGRSMAEQGCHLIFGLIADIQYADSDDGYNYRKTRRRFYRAALTLLKRAVADWKSNRPDMKFVLQLGDLIDGINRRQNGMGAASKALKTVLAPFDDLTCPTYHMVGNHDLYNFQRLEILRSDLNSSKLPCVQGVSDELYYSVLVHSCLRVIVLDTYDVSVLGYQDHQDHPHYKIAVALLERFNFNKDKNSSVGLEGMYKRFVAWNGGVGEKQLAWLDEQLTDADSKQQNVLICGHIQLNAEDIHEVPTLCLLWNYQEVLAVLHAHRCVVGCVAGHDHDGSLTVDSAGISHLVLNGVIETDSSTNAYATAFLKDKTLEIQGAGIVPSVTMPLRYFADKNIASPYLSGANL